jgi:hypothetical protein
MKSTECVWEAKGGFATKYIPAPHHPDLKHLFRECLKIQDANIDMVLETIWAGMGYSINLNEPTLMKLKNLLLALSGYLLALSPWQKKAKIKLLAGRPIVPTYRDHNGKKVVRLKQLDGGFWFYADQQNYREAFGGMVSLADFAQEDWNQVENLCSAARDVFHRRERRLKCCQKKLRYGTVASSSVRRGSVCFVGKAGTLEDKECCSRLGPQY